MNILFICYGNFRSNSMTHIAGFAAGLKKQRHSCIVAVKRRPETIDAIAVPAFRPMVYADLLKSPACFPNDRPADVIHAWTPRHDVATCVIAYQRLLRFPARLILHLEDNERHLLSHTAGVSFETLAGWSDRRLRTLTRKGLSHPMRHQLLLGAADLITGITPRLSEFAPAGTPFADLPPGLDLEAFRPLSADAGLRASLGVRPSERLLVYPGGANLTNAAELRMLYTAVVLLNRSGQHVRLLRTGPSTPWFIESLSAEEREVAIDLGFISRDRLPGLLALADVLVQPGQPGPFNDYRLPSKLPEFLASGRPVILPATNLASLMTDGREALFLRDGSPEDICARCLEVFANSQLAVRLGQAGRHFAVHHFDAETNARRLEALYQETLARPSAADWTRLRTRLYDEAELYPLSPTHSSPAELLNLAATRRAHRRPARLLGRLLPSHSTDKSAR